MADVSNRTASLAAPLQSANIFRQVSNAGRQHPSAGSGHASASSRPYGTYLIRPLDGALHGCRKTERRGGATARRAGA